MSFFDARPPRPARRQTRPPREDWMGAPEGWLGGFVPTRIVLVGNAQLLVTLGPMEAYPTGVSLELQITHRQPTRHFRRDEADDGLQLGVGYADGSKWQGLGERWPSPGEKPPPSPLMWPMGGGGTDRRLSSRYWLWPLPPPGPVTFALAWPQQGVEETTIEIEGAVFRAAAEEAKKLWEPLTEEEEEAALRAGCEPGSFIRSVGVAVSKDDADGGEKRTRGRSRQPATTVFDVAASIDRREPHFSAASSTPDRPLSGHPPRPSA